MRTFSSTVVLLGAVALPAIASAQDAGKGFLFGAPNGVITFRGGWAGATAHSDLFKFTTENLTLDRRDFSSPEIGMDLAFDVHPGTELVASAAISGMDKRSEFRHLIDNNDQPIEQVTTFRRIPLTLSVKQYITPRGQSIGRLAWIPSRAAAYVGAGGGAQYYRFVQSGDFVDSKTMNVYADRYSSEGWTGVAHALGGIDYSLSPRFVITTEGRYAWSRARLSRDFSGFERLDLSGFSTTVGFTIRY